MAGLSYQHDSTDGYRFGFNTQEKEPELGAGITSAEFWMYDGRLGRRWNFDRKISASLSVYSCLQNNPIRTVDPYGDTTHLFTKDGFYIKTIYTSTSPEWHFIETANLELLELGGGPENDPDQFEKNVRAQSTAYFAKDVASQIKDIQNEQDKKDPKHHENAYILVLNKNTRMLRLADISSYLVGPGNSETSIDRGDATKGINAEVGKLDAKVESYFAFGHTHSSREDSDTKPTDYSASGDWGADYFSLTGDSIPC